MLPSKWKSKISNNKNLFAVITLLLAASMCTSTFKARTTEAYADETTPDCSTSPSAEPAILACADANVQTSSSGPVQPPIMEWNRTYGSSSNDRAYSLFVFLNGPGDTCVIAGTTNSSGAGANDLWVVYTHDGLTLWSETYGGTKSEGACSIVEASDYGFIVAGSTYSFGAGGSDFWLVKTNPYGYMVWNKTYGGTNHEYASCVKNTSDGGYVIAGGTASFGTGTPSHPNFWLVKTYVNGTMQWNKFYDKGGDSDGAQSVEQTSDGGYIIAGYTRYTGYTNLWLVKTNSAGTKQWDKVYGGTGYDMPLCVQETNDGGYIIAGYTSSFGAGGRDFWLVKTDSSGELLWNKTYGGPGDEMAHSLLQTDDGGYIIAGDWNSSELEGYGDFWLVRTDSAGNMMWNKTYGGDRHDAAYSIQHSNWAEYIIAGYSNSFGAGNYDAYLVWTDSDGSMRSDRKIERDSEEAFCVQQTSDQGYIAAGSTNSFGSGQRDFYLVKTDASGDLEWNKTYGGARHERASSVRQTSEGGYIVAGNTGSFGAGGRDFWLVKTDSSGELLWNKTYGGDYDDGASSVEQTIDGGYILAGYTDSFGPGVPSYSNLYMVKTDSAGNIVWNKTYGGESYDRAFSVIQTSDGRYILAGYTSSFGVYYDFYLAKTDSSGELLWNKTYGGSGYQSAKCVQETTDKGYILAGYTSLPQDDFWLVKTDIDGIMLWNMSCGGSNYESAFYVQQTSDKGYIVAGYKSHVFDIYLTDMDIWLVKLRPYVMIVETVVHGEGGEDHTVIMESNASLRHEIANQNNLHFWAEGTPGETYYVNITLPVGLNTSEIKVFIDGQWLQPPPWPEITTNGTHYFVYFEFTASTHKIIVEYRPESWPMFHHDLIHTGYSTSTAPDTNNTIWNYTTGDDVFSSPAIDNGKLYVGSDDHNVYCLNSTSGEKIWNYTTGDKVFPSPAVADGRVYVGSYDTYVYCLNASTGDFIWRAYTFWTYSSPSVAYGRVYVGSGNYRVYCLNATDGTPLWLYPTDSPVYSSPAVYDGRVYIGSDDYKIYCLNATTGFQIWNYTTGGIARSSPTVAFGNVYFGSCDNQVYCLDATTGTHIWNYTTGFRVLYSTPAVADGKIYIGSEDNKVYCLDATTGTHIWNYTTGHDVWPSPAVADGKVYIGSHDRHVYCLNATNGDFIWSYKTGAYVLSSPAVADGNVYIGSSDNNVYAFGPLPGIHDVAVTNITLSKTVIGQNYTGTFWVTVENQGDFTEVFNVSAFYDGSTVAVPQQWPTLTQLSSFWSMGDVNKDGYIDNFDICLIAAAFGTDDPDCDINDDDIVDIYDANICASNYGLDIWTHLELSQTLRNETVVNLPTGGSLSVGFRWNTTGVAKGNYTISATADTVPGETGTTDNSFTDDWIIVAMIGDITGPDGWPDGKCDMRDVGTVARIFGEQCTETLYDIDYDITGPTTGMPDGTIDMRDIGLVARHFGETDP